ncbi:uncharacterized protein LOC143667471 isoform X1 [Tamandua tetradactyla]|uniref:uncharacterized protein LOC143667471 isoform X1 n=1 Tax=Tamandua tetradactyla TaxID=48850 RepID=UPI0040542364
MPGEASACLFSSLKIGDLTFSDRPQPGAPLSAHRASGPLPLFNKQVVDSCIIHISLDGDHGNVPKSIVITCHDRALAVILKAMDEYHLDLEAAKYYKLVQIISPDRSKPRSWSRSFSVRGRFSTLLLAPTTWGVCPRQPPKGRCSAFWGSHCLKCLPTATCVSSPCVIPGCNPSTGALVQSCGIAIQDKGLSSCPRSSAGRAPTSQDGLSCASQTIMGLWTSIANIEVHVL